MTELKEGQKLERVVRVHGVELPVAVTIRAGGVEFRVRGSKKSITAPWTSVVNACFTEPDVPSFLMGKPLEFLKHTSAQIVKRRVAKAEKGR